jgi:immune inhibitor A
LKTKRFLALFAAASLAVSLSGTATAAAPRDRADDRAHHSDNLPGDLAKKQLAQKQKAQELVLAGKAKPVGKNKVVQLAKGQFVELAFEGEDQIFTLLGEFGTQQANAHPNHPPHGGTPGPLHNEIPQPDRSVDNTTIWVEDFSQAHYDELLYSKGTNPSMANWYLEQSSGTYSVDGYVSDWVGVPFNAAAYGSNYCGSIVCTRDIGRFLADQGVAWYDAMLAAGNSAADIEALLAPFDVWDRYDFDGDGDFDEADGYLDHYQSVHAGIGEETCSPDCNDAIWSHRSYANGGASGVGPTVNGVPNLANGIRLGSSSKWIGDYTIEPENGGVGVFAHEFGHDLGLPDLYDTSGNTGGAENSTAWWTIMSQGSYGSVNGEDIGSAPTHFGAWEKFQLGFLKDYTAVRHTASGTFNLGPAESNTKRPQAMFIVLPDKLIETDIGDPFEGSYFYHSGSGDELDTTMTKSITLGAAPIDVAFKAKYHIETCWDYAYLQVSTNGGTSWTNVHTSVSDAGNENGQNDGEGITGVSGQPKACDSLAGEPAWVDVTADLSAYANSTVLIRFNYETDTAVIGEGFGFDNLQITSLPMDGAETDTEGWTFDGFSRTTGTTITPYFNAYVLENRQYVGYDKALELGPYNFGFPESPNLVEHFPYQDGLLISYWDSSFHDNNVGDHPGEGLILPVDSHPTIGTWSDDGTQMRPRINSYDSTFTTTATDSITLHNPVTGVATTIASKPAVSVFDDSKSYWVSGHPTDAPANGRYQAEWNSVKVPNACVVVRVKSISSTGLLTLDLNK